jgi:hypothetical protein
MKRGAFGAKALVVSLVLVVGIAAFLFQRPAAAPTGASDPQAWSARIKALGPQAAYDELKRTYREDFGPAHMAAHLFGVRLYEYAGLSGIQVCDESFSFGCYHGFFSRAIGDRGFGVISQLDEACLGEEDASGVVCRHGIGHGLVELLGPGRLRDALRGCEELGQGNSSLFGCAGGVFMEYHLPIPDIAAGKTVPRPLEPGKSYDPCDGDLVAAPFMPACYFGLGTWWDRVYNGDYGQIGVRCAAVQDATYRTACFEGAGKIAAASSRYEAGPAIKKCEMMPDPAGRRSCRAGASWSFFASPQRHDRAAELCDGLSPADTKACLAEASSLAAID